MSRTASRRLPWRFVFPLACLGLLIVFLDQTYHPVVGGRAPKRVGQVSPPARPSGGSADVPVVRADWARDAVEVWFFNSATSAIRLDPGRDRLWVCFGGDRRAVSLDLLLGPGDPTLPPKQSSERAVVGVPPGYHGAVTVVFEKWVGRRLVRVEKDVELMWDADDQVFDSKGPRR